MYYLGYDVNTKHLFSSDENFNFLYNGCISKDELPDVVKNAINDNDLFSISGNDYFSCSEKVAVWTSTILRSGLGDNNYLSIYMSGEDLQVAFVERTDNSIKFFQIEPEVDFINKYNSISICIGGAGVKNPVELSKLVRKFPNNKVFVSDLAEADVAFGVMLANIIQRKHIRPRRISFEVINNSEIETINEHYADEKVEFDVFGQMVQSIISRGFIINDICNTVGISPYYGKILSGNFATDDCVFLIHQELMQDLFPTEVISVKHYAGACVPIEMSCTEKFKKQTGWQKDKAVIRVVTHKDGEKWLAFFRFAWSFLENVIIVSESVSDQLNLPNEVLLSREDKICKITKNNLFKMYNKE